MKILNRLTLKHLSMNKKRTLVTIIGIVLSTALMVGLGLLTSTFLNVLKEDAIHYSGPSFANFRNLDAKEYYSVEENVNVDKTYGYGILGYAKIDSDNFYKPYLYIVSGNDTLLNYETLTSGHLPTSDNEIILPNHLANTNKYKLGDTITLDIGVRLIDDEEVTDNNVGLDVMYEGSLEDEFIRESFIPKKKKTYKIVGFYNRSTFEPYSAPGYMAYTYHSSDILRYDAYVTYKNVKKTFTYTDEICSSLKEATCSTNDSLLYYYGISRYNNINSSIIFILVIVLSLLSFGSIVVIYNSFAISTMERKKSFGLYSSLGATPKQIRYTVFFEAFVVGLIGIILGLLGSFLGIYSVVLVLDHLLKGILDFNLTFTVNLLYVMIPLIFMILTIFISAYIPARKASKVSALSLIRENDEIKIPKRKFKIPAWIFKLFGMEGEIALKNIKRNKRKYRITLLSLFMSIVLFISFSTYLKVMLTAINLEDLPKYDLYVYSEDVSKLDEIRGNSLIQKSYKTKMYSIYLKDSDDKNINENYLSYLGEAKSISALLYVFDDTSFKNLTENLHLSSQTPFFYNQVSYTEYNNNNRKSYQTKVFNHNLSSLKVCDSEEEKCDNLSLTMTTEKDELLSSFRMPTPLIIMSESMYKESFLKNENEREMSILYAFSDDYEKLYNELVNTYKNDNDISFYAPKIELKQTKNVVLALKILFYGFISLVTLIGVTSVFNTIYTSIHLRKKEFAMLRSVGLSPKGFNRMLFFESFFFGFKSLFYSLPVSFIMVALINLSMGGIYEFGHLVIPYKAIFLAIFGVFILILVTTLYSAKKIKKENILEALKDENI